jgi:hypothetical protein
MTRKGEMHRIGGRSVIVVQKYGKAFKIQLLLEFCSIYEARNNYVKMVQEIKKTYKIEQYWGEMEKGSFSSPCNIRFNSFFCSFCLSCSIKRKLINFHIVRNVVTVHISGNIAYFLRPNFR